MNDFLRRKSLPGKVIRPTSLLSRSLGGCPSSCLGGPPKDEAAITKRRETMQRVRDLMAKLEPQREIPDVQDLWYFEEREDVGDWLRRHGWDVTVMGRDGHGG